jgi:hypothetical protein
MANERLWGIPSWTILIAVVLIGVFMWIAFGLYSSWYGVSTHTGAYLLKVGDAFINGAIVGIFFAAVKTIFELPKWYQEWDAARKAAKEVARVG